jgi:hypothetical protein
LLEQFSIPTSSTGYRDEQFALGIENLGNIATIFWAPILFLLHACKHTMVLRNQKVIKTLLTNCLAIGYSVGVAVAA